METRTGKTIKIVRTDGGTEYKGEFQYFLSENGIVKQRALPYQHWHPGQCERAHQTIMSLKSPEALYCIYVTTMYDQNPQPTRMKNKLSLRASFSGW